MLRAILRHQEIQVTGPLAVSTIIHGSGGSHGEEKRDQPEEVKAALNNVKRRLKSKLESRTKQNKKTHI